MAITVVTDESTRWLITAWAFYSVSVLLHVSGGSWSSVTECGMAHAVLVCQVFALTGG